MGWRLALIDSCGEWPGALDAAAFASVGGAVEVRAPEADTSGHGSGIARIVLGAGADGGGDGDVEAELLLAQVFLGRARTTAAAVAAAIDWSLARGANLLHLSLGLGADRGVLREATARAVSAGAVLVASVPARGGVVFPAAYAGVIRATGDARCAPGELSMLGPFTFGGCASAGGTADQGGTSEAARGADGGRGASFGAAWVSRSLLEGAVLAGGDAAAAALAAQSRYRGAERHSAAAMAPAGPPQQA